jgi:RNA polymerase sigma factor (sigma-70 family)
MSPQTEKIRIAEFFRTEYRKLLGFVRRRVDAMAARDPEDFVHDVAVNLFDRADIGRPIEHLSSYVYQALQNRITDHFRKRRKAVSLEEIEQNPSGTGENNTKRSFPGPGDGKSIRQMESAHDLDRLMVGLNEEEKKLILATEIQGRTFRDLSQSWDVSVGTLLSRKSRALSKIKTQLEEMNLKE